MEVRPQKEPFLWTAETKRHFIHHIGRFLWMAKEKATSEAASEVGSGGGGGMAGARATLGIVRGGTVNGSER